MQAYRYNGRHDNPPKQKYKILRQDGHQTRIHHLGKIFIYKMLIRRIRNEGFDNISLVCGTPPCSLSVGSWKTLLKKLYSESSVMRCKYKQLGKKMFCAFLKQPYKICIRIDKANDVYLYLARVSI